MRSDLNYKEVWEFKPPNCNKNLFIEEISLVPFQIIKEFSIKDEYGKQIKIYYDWNPIIYKDSCSREEWSNKFPYAKYGYVIHLTEKLLNKNEWNKILDIWQRQKASIL